jgi:hypothetical protein
MKQQLQEALLAAKNGREEDARVLLAQFLRDEPESVAAWVLLSKLATSGAQKAAFLRKVLELEPDHAYARRALDSLEADSRPEAEAAPEGAEGGTLPEDDGSEEWDWDDDVGVTAPETMAEPSGGHEEEGTEPDSFSFEEEDLAEEELAAALEESDAQRTLPDADASPDFEEQMRGDTLPPWLPEDEIDLPEATPGTVEADQEEALPEWLAQEAQEEWPDLQDEAQASWSLSEEEEARRAAEQEAELAQAMESPPQPSESRNPWRTVALLAVAILIFLLLAYAVLSFL